MDRVKEFLKRYKKAIINLLLTLAVMILLTAVIAVVLILCGILYYDDGVQINVHIFDSFRNSWL